MDRDVRIAGWAGLLLGAMMLVAFALDMAVIATTGGPPEIQPGHLAADLTRAAGSSLWAVETWVYTLLIVPFIVFIAGLRSAVRAAGHPGLADWGALAGLVFAGLHTLHNLLILVAVQVMGPAYVAGGHDATALLATTKALLGLAYATFLPGSGLGTPVLIISMLAFAAAQRAGAPGGRWAAGLALASALLLAVAELQAFIPPAFFIALVAWIANIGWTIASAGGLLRGSLWATDAARLHARTA